MFNKPSLKSEHKKKKQTDMNSSLLTPSSSSSSPHHLQSPATFDHDDFLQNFFSSAPWPSSALDDDAPPPTSDSSLAGFHHHDVDSRNQITMIPLSHHNPNDAVDVNALYSGFSAGSLPFHFPQGSGGGVMKQSHTQTQSQATASTTTGGTAATPQTKPKVRARRGQATDPHSIAERDAGGSNENTSGENQTTAKMTEHQVAKLMEEDMGSAMQYLQGKGLCLMPISLATTISTATCPSRNPLISAVKEAGVPLSPNAATTPVVNVKGASVVTVKDASSVSKP
ncbi:hypothetical protein YC2023_007748 [Brassica napus]